MKLHGNGAGKHAQAATHISGTVVAQDQPLGFLSENEAPFQDVIYDIDDVDDMFHIISRCPTFLDLFGGLLHVQYSSVWPHVST